MKDVNTVRTALLAALPAGTPTSELVMAQVDRAAELSVLAARLRQKALAGRRTDLDRVMRLENLVSRLLRSLNLDKLPKPAPVKFPWLARGAAGS